MDLQSLLKKTESRSAKIKSTRQPPSIATDDRPYTNDLQLDAASGLEKIVEPDKNSSDKPGTNLGQSSDKPGTNLGQSSDKPGTNLGQSSDLFEVNLGQTSDKLRSQLRTEARTNLGQTSDKLRTNESFSTLVGLQRKITLFIHQCCQFARDKITEPLTIEQISTSCETTVLSAQKTIQRLEKKSILLRAKFRNGRGGWTQYELPNNIFQEILHLESQDKLRTNLGQTSDKLRSQLRTELRTSPSSSSSSSFSIDNKTTTTEELQIADKQNHELPPEWEIIDFGDLPALGVHFGQPQLKQWHDRNYCTPQQAQESIYHFAFYLKHSKKGDIKTGPLNFFMGIMSKQKYFARPDGYLSPDEEGMKKRVEDLKKRDENLKFLEQELYDYSFDIWFRSLTEDEIQEHAPNIYQYEPRKSVLKQVFLNKYWLKVKSNPDLDPARLGKFEIEEKRNNQAKSLEPEELLSREEVSRLIDQSLASAANTT